MNLLKIFDKVINFIKYDIKVTFSVSFYNIGYHTHARKQMKRNKTYQRLPMAVKTYKNF